MKNHLPLLFFSLFVLTGFALFFIKSPRKVEKVSLLSQGETSSEEREGQVGQQAVQVQRREKAEDEGSREASSLAKPASAKLPKSKGRVELKGLVVDPLGRPLPDAVIGFRYPVTEGGSEGKSRKEGAKVEYQGLRLGSTELNGTFSFLLKRRYLEKGKLTVTHSRFTPQALPPVLGPGGSVEAFRIRMKKGVSFQIVLQDEQRPLPGLEVDLTQYRVDEPDALPIGGILMDGLGLGIQIKHGRSDAMGVVPIHNWPEGKPVLMGVFGKVRGMRILSIKPRFKVLPPFQFCPKNLVAFFPEAGKRYGVEVIPDPKRILRIQGKALGFTKEERSKIFAWVFYHGSGPLIRLKWIGESFRGTHNLFEGSKTTTSFSLVFRMRGATRGEWKVLKTFGPFDLASTRTLSKLLLQKP